MGDLKKLESAVAQAVTNALEQLLPDLRGHIVRQVLDLIGPELESLGSRRDHSALNRALEAVQSGTTQVQILDAMIEGIAEFAARTAVYIVRGSNAVGWRAIGFSDNDRIRNTPLDVGAGLAATALQNRAMITGKAEQFMSGLGTSFDDPGSDCLVCPLVVRDKVVAVVYVDGGMEGKLDRPAVEALIRTSGLWLEIFATRKATGPVSAPAIGPAAAMTAAAAASPAPRRMTTAVSEPEPPSPVAVPHSPAEPAPASSAKDEDIHNKARRFAKLLVDEIKLYNQAKVSEGRENRDLYDRLRDDIEKSRASYEKRYGDSPAKAGDYFNRELIRILADNDASLLGENFPR